MDGQGFFYERGGGLPIWWLYEVTNKGPVLTDPDKLPARPKDARSSGGNPYTPYYQSVEHWDALHIHILAKDRYNADRRAMSIYQEHYHVKVRKQQQDPPSK